MYQKPQLIRIFSKLQYTNLHTKAVAFLHSSNEIAEKELGKNSLFTVAPGLGGAVPSNKPKQGHGRLLQEVFKTLIENARY